MQTTSPASTSSLEQEGRPDGQPSRLPDRRPYSATPQLHSLPDTREGAYSRNTQRSIEWLFNHSSIDDPFGYGQRAVDFLHILKHPKSRSKGKAFELPPWQERIVRQVYGPCHADGRRIVRNVVILLPRGNRKTSLGAALSLLHLFGPERQDGGQVICAAADQKQARIAFEEAAGIVRADRRIERRLKFMDYRNRIEHPRSGVVMEAISCDAGTQHGRTPTFVLADELHAWKKRDLWDVLRTGLTKVPGSLLVVITTAGRGQENIAWNIVDYARKVARGDVDDPATLPILFETSKDADWRDETIWHAVNPGLAYGFPDIEGLRQLAREAAERPGDRDAFRQLHLNVWLDHSADPFVDMCVYDEGAEAAIDLEALRGRSCWIGVDLSSSIDLTAIVACWRGDCGEFIVHPWFLCPKENLREREDLSGAPYTHWEREGLIQATPGNVIDHVETERVIRDLCEKYNVCEIAFDPAMAGNVMRNLGDEGYPVVEMRPGPLTMMPVLAELERAIIGRKLKHGGNPILRFCFANCEVESNSHGHKVRLHKSKRWLSIDGAFACAMAVSRAATGEGVSIYDSPDFRPEMMVL